MIRISFFLSFVFCFFKADAQSVALIPVDSVIEYHFRAGDPNKDSIIDHQDSLFPNKSLQFTYEINFAAYLTDNAEYDDVILLLNTMDNSLYENLQSKKDSFNYYLGWSFYNVKNLDSSSFFFSQVSNESSFYMKSRFYNVFNNIYDGKIRTAKTLLNSGTMEQKGLNQLLLLDLAGIALLERNFVAFDSISGLFDFSFYPVTAEQKSFLEYSVELQSIKKKSLFLAGAMSAVIPGSGKYYAGYKGQALAAFFQVATLGAVAGENYYRAGPSSAQFITFASLFTLFYVGNIWGSVLSVKIKKDELNRKINEEIFLDLHLPLRRTFN